MLRLLDWRARLLGGAFEEEEEEEETLELPFSLLSPLRRGADGQNAHKSTCTQTLDVRVCRHAIMGD